MGPTPEESNSADAAPATVLRLPQRVVTLRLLEGRLQGIARVEVIPRAIVTPLVQDELRQRGVIRIEERENQYADHPYSVIVLDNTHPMVQAVVERMKRREESK